MRSFEPSNEGRLLPAFFMGDTCDVGVLKPFENEGLVNKFGVGENGAK